MFEDTILVTHKDCIDGSGCAILFLANGGEEKNLYFVGPKSINKVAEDLLYREEEIIFTDCSISVDMAEKYSFRKDITLLDHHKTSIHLKKFDWCEIDEENTRCGSMMFNDIVKDHKYNDLIKFIDDYDRWIHQYYETKEIKTLHDLYGQKEFIYRFLEYNKCCMTEEEDFMIDVEKNRQNKYINTKLNNLHHAHIDGVNCVFVYNEEYKMTSGVGNAILDKHSDVDVAVMVGMNTVSMRSREGFDCSEIAKLYGGGGHLRAAGFQTKALLGNSFIKLVIQNFKVN